MRRALKVLLYLIIGLALAFFTILAPLADRSMNKVVPAGPPRLSPAAESLHAHLSVVDLHADALLWDRDLMQPLSHGHVDLPRLQQGNVAIQVFSAVTKTPRGINYERNSAETDNITLLAAAERYPLRAWRSLLQRALLQASKLRQLESASNGVLVILRSGADVDSLMARRIGNSRLVGAILATEGLQPLEGRVEYLDSLVSAGYRVFGLTHFFDNEVAASAHGESKGGLTPFGREVIAALEQRSLLIDVAHASPRTIDEVLALATRPVLVSHTGVQATCPGPRNLSDDQLRRIAATGGVIGIGFWDGAICEASPESAARAIRHAVSVAGEDHVALGSDFDGSTTVPFDAAQLSLLTDALLREGLSEGVIRKVMGENAIRVFRAALPEH